MADIDVFSRGEESDLEYAIRTKSGGELTSILENALQKHSGKSSDTSKLAHEICSVVLYALHQNRVAGVHVFQWSDRLRAVLEPALGGETIPDLTTQIRSLTTEILAYVPDPVAVIPKKPCGRPRKKEGSPTGDTGIRANTKLKEDKSASAPPESFGEDPQSFRKKSLGSTYRSGLKYGPESWDGGMQIYCREIGKIDLLTPDQEIELAERIKGGDHKARNHMIEANLRLVVKIAQDYANYGLSLLDLVSEGNRGLMTAVGRFDPNKGGKLSTYASYWIKQSIKRALANQSKAIRLPVHMVDKISKMRRVAMMMSEELGREPTDEELSEELGIDRAKIHDMKVASMRPASLDAPISDENGTELGEIVADEKAQTPFDLLSHKNMHSQLDGLLVVLDERERKIIDARFGLAGQKPRTLEEVGQQFGVTRERIRQVQNIALRKLRRALQTKEEPAPKALRNSQNKRKGPMRPNQHTRDVHSLGTHHKGRRKPDGNSLSEKSKRTISTGANFRRDNLLDLESRLRRKGDIV